MTQKAQKKDGFFARAGKNRAGELFRARLCYIMDAKKTREGDAVTTKEQILACLRHEPGAETPPAELMNLMAGSPLLAMLSVPARERPLHGAGYDIFGVHWSATEDISHRTPGQKPIYDDIEDWREQVRFPNVDKFEWDELRRDAEAVDREKQLVGVMLYTGPFERATELTSMEDCLVNLMLDPESFSELIGAIADYKIQVIEKCWEYARPDIFVIHDDWGTMKSTFMNPALWREVIKPHTQRIYDAIRAHGAIIAQHSCGAIGPLVGDMVEMGADAWDGQPECNDFAALRAQYGDRLVILDKPPMPDASEGELPPMPGEKYAAYAEYPEFLFD